MKQEHQLIYELEISLLRSETRKSIAQLKLLIADEFIEYGASGSIYNKNDLLDSLPEEEQRSYMVNDFSVLEVSPEVMLATYKVTVASKVLYVLRSGNTNTIVGKWCFIKERLATSARNNPF